MPILRPTIEGNRRWNSIASVATFGVTLSYLLRQSCRRLGSSAMAWKKPKIVEVQVGMEINMYACAARK
jgi:coenzyme PQQ precursor peptide PqqA